MNRQVILSELKNFFIIEELVDKPTFEKYGDKCWRYFSTELLHTLLTIRKELDKPITINNWKWGGKFSQRGLRVNTCSIVSKKTSANKIYCSAHCLGQGIDFDVEDMTADEVRIWLKQNQDILPYKIRLEHKIARTGKTISWVHLDTYWEENNPKIYLFNV